MKMRVGLFAALALGHLSWSDVCAQQKQDQQKPQPAKSDAFPNNPKKPPRPETKGLNESDLSSLQ
jgi:hypothetical protein